MNIFAVIGANYGDEGKGQMTDYLCHVHGIDTVVRFNGGAQAGHTVVTPEGLRHVFSHLASGTLTGARTVLSEFFICNPALFRREHGTLLPEKKILVHEDCLVTTPFDMLKNQHRERSRGNERHGSCGVGIREAQLRHELFPLTVGNLTQGTLQNRLEHILYDYSFTTRSMKLGIESREELFAMLHRFMEDCRYFLDHVELYSGDLSFKQGVVFEGAQGLLLDQHNLDDFPYLTPSNTGLRNVQMLMYRHGLQDTLLRALYVTRTYLTRHGAGPLINEVPRLTAVVDETNVPHPWQGDLRYGVLDTEALLTRVTRDGEDDRRIKVNKQLAVTWADVVHHEVVKHAHYVALGKTRADVNARDDFQLEVAS